VQTADLDGDGDADVLSASWIDDKIDWYEDLGGGSLGPQQVISVAANGAVCVQTADPDGDGDRDALSASDRRWVGRRRAPADGGAGGPSGAWTAGAVL